jgi:hypothetical protein
MERKPPSAEKGQVSEGSAPGEAVTPSNGGHGRGREFARGDAATDPILRNLKLAFAEVESEPLSDELRDLIAELQASDKEGGAVGRN